jgi:hypothetical protein
MDLGGVFNSSLKNIKLGTISFDFGVKMNEHNWKFEKTRVGLVMEVDGRRERERREGFWIWKKKWGLGLSLKLGSD